MKSISLLAISALLLTACTNQPAQTNVVANDDSMEEEHDMMMDMDMEMPPPLTAEEASVFQAGLPLEERSELAVELAMKMPTDGMKQMLNMFPDLEKVEDIPTDDPRNLMKMSAESWHYSEEGDFIIVVCDAVDSPMHVFSGAIPTQAHIDEAIEMMHEMMSGDPDDMMMNMSGDHAAAEINTAVSTIAFSEEAAEYTEYSKEKYDNLLGQKPMALFFHADWCGTCKYMEKNIKEELASFPDGTKIVEVNFDKEDELKFTYNILVQSTVVIVDKNGKVSKTLAAPDNRELIAAIEDTL